MTPPDVLTALRAAPSPFAQPMHRDDARGRWIAAYQAVRGETARRAAPLSAEDQGVQSMADASPTKWHRAHTTWFFEQFLLASFVPGYRPFDPRYAFLFNSYYVAAGPRHDPARSGEGALRQGDDSLAIREAPDASHEPADWRSRDTPGYDQP